MAVSSGNLLKKFRGSLMGCLVGDCLGEKFESAEMPVAISSKRVSKFFTSLKNGEIKPGSLQYTDDSAMTKEIAKSLIYNKAINSEDLANKLTELYFAEPFRGYGVHVGHVFEEIKSNKLRNAPDFDVLKPARDQFNGSGSYGNGAAMRVAPVGLLFNKSIEDTIKNARESALITHAHRNGVNGAVLQALAIREAVLADESNPVDPLKFIVKLKEELRNSETTERENQGATPFCDQLRKIESLLPLKSSISQVVAQLGNDVTALKSVPTAIYAFLAAQKPIDDIISENVFERTVYYAISLGGDTDTIACMAGGICGAYYGEDIIPSYLIEPCEDQAEMKKIAEKLYQVL